MRTILKTMAAIAFVAALACGSAFGATPLSVVGGDVQHDAGDGNLEIDGGSIAGDATLPGSYTVNGDTVTNVVDAGGGILTVENNGARGGSLVINGGIFTNEATVNINRNGADGTGSLIVQSGTFLNDSALNVSGMLDVRGGEFSSDGVTTINSGGEVNITSGATFGNQDVMHFQAGSSFSGTGSLSNQFELHIDTDMQVNGSGKSSAIDLLNATTMDDTGYIFLKGDSANLEHRIDYDGATNYGPVVVIQTSDNTNRYDFVDVDKSQLRVDTDTDFTGAVSGAKITVYGGTSTFRGKVDATHTTDPTFQVNNGTKALFTGNTANFASGNVVIQASGEMSLGDGAEFTSAGTVSNSGSLTFYSDAVYSGSGTITNLANGVLSYSTGNANLANLMLNSNLEEDSYLHLFDLAALSPTTNLEIGAAAENSFVIIDDGGTFGGLNVKSATLDIHGGTLSSFAGTVAAKTITVTGTGGAQFKSVVNGDLDVTTSAEFADGSSFGAFNITVRNGGSLVNNSSNLALSQSKNMDVSGTFTNNKVFANNGAIDIATTGRVVNETTALFENNQTGTIVNNGQFENKGEFSNKGSYDVVGRFTNSGEFVNSGTFKNSSTTSGHIHNTDDGVMTFTSSTSYTGSGTGGVGGAYLIRNDGFVNASASMGDTSLRALIRDLDLRSGSEFNLTATSDASISGSFEFGYTATNSSVRFALDGKTLTMNQNTTFNTDYATLTIGEGKVTMMDNTRLETDAQFTVENKGNIDFSQGTGRHAYITAANASFEGASSVSVGERNTLHINLTDASSSATGLVMNGTSSMNIGKQGVVDVTGKVQFNSGTSLVVGTDTDIGKLQASGTITFDKNTKLTITATDSSISQVVSTGGNIVVAASGTTEVIFKGSRENLVGKFFLLSQNGTIDNETNLYNSLYQMEVIDVGGGEGMRITGLRSVLDTMENTFGGKEYLSENKINGGHYTDEALNSEWGLKNDTLADYIQEASKDEHGFDKSYAAYGQLYGEYGAYAATPMMTATRAFHDTLSRRMSNARIAGGDECNVCYNVVQEDPCDVCGGSGSGEQIVSLVAMSPSSPNNGVWAGVFGDWTRQKGKKLIHGYDYNAGGINLGYDYSTDDLTVGIAGSYTDGTLKVKTLGTKYDSDIFNVALYGMYTHHETNVYVKGQAGFGYGWNDYDVNMVLGGTKHGKYKNQSYSASLEFGYNGILPNDFSFTPYTGLDYVHLSQEAWSEDVKPAEDVPIVANRFDRQRYNSVEIPVGLRLGKLFTFDEIRLATEVRGAWVYQANDHRDRIQAGYAGHGGYATMYGVDAGRSRGMVGGGLKAYFINNFAVSVDYDLDFKGAYREHNLTGTLSLGF